MVSCDRSIQEEAGGSEIEASVVLSLRGREACEWSESKLLLAALF